MPDFSTQLRKWSEQTFYGENVRKMQLPFTLAAKPAPADPELLRAKRQEQAKRLVEMNARKREEKVLVT